MPDPISAFFGKPKATPNIPGLKLPDFTTGLQDFSKQEQFIPALEKTANAANIASNTDYRNSIFGLAPGLSGALSNLSNQANQLSQGLIPTDVANQVTRNAAYQNFSAGISPMGGQGQGLTAKDLGLTSLNLINQGSQLAGQSLQMSQALTPNNLSVNSLLFNPAQLLQRRDQQAQIDYGNQLQNQQIDFQNSLRQSPFNTLLNNTFASVVSAPFNFVGEVGDIAGNAPNLAAGFFAGAFGGAGGAQGVTSQLKQKNTDGSTKGAPTGGGGGMSQMGSGNMFGSLFSGGTNPGTNQYSTGQQTYGGSANQWGVDSGNIMNAPVSSGGGGGGMFGGFGGGGFGIA